MIIFLLPVYNEEKNIIRLLNDISRYSADRKWDHQIFISDDGSVDSTVSLAESVKGKMPITIVSSLVNKGPGGAFDAGFTEILKGASDDDIIVTMEADNTSDLETLAMMVSEMEQGADLVLASCYGKGGRVTKISFLRRILSKGANVLVKVVFKEKGVNTFSSFYRCHKAGVLKKAYSQYGNKFIEEKGFTCAVDMFLKLSRLNIRIVEVPSTLNCNLRVGRSKMKMLKTTLAYLRLFARETVRRYAHLDK